jgi:glutamyl-tRNA synthetase
MYTSLDIANLLFPDLDITVSELLEKYPKRNSSENALVTRFAPSPTGYVHIGGVYQAVINSFLAHSTGGKFMLRCEDTDKKREVEGSADLIYPLLIKMGIKIDEGYVSKTEEIGEYGPYLQSKRTKFYQAFAYDLVSRGLAYPCFCTEEEEETSRNEQKRLSVPSGYYGRWAKCRNLSYEQVKENLERF